MVVFGWLQGPRGSSETVIPLVTSIKNQVFKVSAARTPLGSTFEWPRERLRMFPEPFWGVSLGSLGHFDGGPCQQLSFFFSPRQGLDDFLASSGCQGPFRLVFWPFLVVWRYVSSCFLFLLRRVFKVPPDMQCFCFFCVAFLTSSGVACPSTRSRRRKHVSPGGYDIGK